MFRLVIPECLPLPITVHPPDGGEGSFTLRMRYLSMTERQTYLQRIQSEHLTDPEIVRELVVGWDGLCGADAAPLDFHDDDARALVLDTPFVFGAIREAVLDELIYRHLPAGNSEPSPATGPRAAEGAAQSGPSTATPSKHGSRSAINGG